MGPARPINEEKLKNIFFFYKMRGPSLWFYAYVLLKIVSPPPKKKSSYIFRKHNSTVTKHSKSPRYSIQLQHKVAKKKTKAMFIFIVK